MDFVDKKIVFLTSGDPSSSRAVSSKLPIAINESALYPRFEGGTTKDSPKQKQKIHCDGSDSTIVARNRVSWVGCRGTIIYGICSTRLSRKGILKILVAFPWHIVLDISLFLMRCRRRYLCESIRRLGCYNIIEYQAWYGLIWVVLASSRLLILRSPSEG